MENATKPWAIGMTVLAGMARMAQHLNFAPVGALSLFAGARLRGWQAYALPVALMAVTDPFLGGYSSGTPLLRPRMAWTAGRLYGRPAVLPARPRVGSVL